MAEKKESKIELEREYVINVRRKVSYVPHYRRANKAIKSIKEFLAKHMKVENRDTRKVKMDTYLNQEMWFKGIKNPPTRIKVKAKKIDGIVYAELADVPKVIQYQMDRDNRRKSEAEKQAPKKPVVSEPIVEKTEEEKIEEKEKGQATEEAGLKEQKQEAKREKHEVKQKPLRQNQIKRKSMQK